MSLDELRLPGYIIQDLFRKSLVEMNDKNVADIQANKELNFFGGNKQHIILLVNTPDIAFITDEQLTFLSGILNACKLTLEDVGLININSYPGIGYKKIVEIFSPRIVMMFGILPDTIQLPFVMPHFQTQSYNSRVYVAAPSLNELENNKDLKRKLWNVLQQIFSL